jgi:hypothetical protein
LSKKYSRDTTVFGALCDMNFTGYLCNTGALPAINIDDDIQDVGMSMRKL